MIGLIHCYPPTTLYYEERQHVLEVTAQGCEIMSPFIKRVMISQVGLITNSRVCAFISNAVTLNAVTSSLIWEGQMIDQKHGSVEHPWAKAGLESFITPSLWGLYESPGRKDDFWAVTFVLPLLIMAPF